MPFNGSGVWNLPTGEPVVTGTTILSTTHNTLVGDIQASFNNCVTRDGQGVMSGPFKLTDGTANAPGLAFNAESSTGLFRPTTGFLGVTTSGIERARFTSLGAFLIATTTDDGVNKLQVSGGITGTNGAFSGTLGVTGTSTLGVVNTGALGATTGAFSSTLSVTGTSTLGVTHTGALLATTTNYQVQATNGTNTAVLGASGGSSYVGSFDATLLSIIVGNAEKMRILTSGDVGINSTSPSTLGGNITTVEVMGHSTTRGGGLRLPTSDRSLEMLVYAADGLGSIGTSTAHPLSIVVGNAEKMRLDTSGNLIVGATSRSGIGGGADLINAAGSIGFTTQLNGNTTGEMAICNRGSGGMGLYVNSASVEALTILANGHVGLNQVPTHLLDVNGSSGFAADMNYSDGSASWVIGRSSSFISGGGATNFGLRSNGSAFEFAFSGGSPLMTLGSSGSLGVGSAGTSGVLVVVGGGAANPTPSVLALNGYNNAASQLRVLWNNPASYIGVGQDSLGNFILGTAATINGASPTTLMKVTQAGVITDTNGNELGWKSLPVDTPAATSNAVVTQRSKMVVGSFTSYTINTGIFSRGDVITVYQDSTISMTIIQGAGVTLRLAGTSSTGTRTLASRGFATILFNSSTEAIVGGPGVS